jgi:aminopeptidase N
MKYFISLFFILFTTWHINAQSKFTLADTLRGSLRPERTCFDVIYYNLDLLVNIKKQRISGFNDIHFRIVEETSEIQLDLYENMKITSIEFQGRELNFRRVFNALFIQTPPLQVGAVESVRVYYEGAPKISSLPPWDGGFVWKTDSHGNPWIGVACEGAGASLWWPNKDHLSDEPDSMSIHVTIPNDLMCVANGNLRKATSLEGGLKKFSWHVQYPINNYNVSINIADYAHFSDTYYAFDGDSLDLDYYVLRENLYKAKSHFKQTSGVLEAFEHYFGKYPFWDDGFCLVETPYLGMEHQSAIAYGNKYQRGYLGSMIPRELSFDYVIVHETGHEYWGNCISVADHADMWIHESFTTYMESLFVEYHNGKEAATRYLNYQRPFITNRSPIVGPLHVNFTAFNGSDNYYKGAWVLHTLRNMMENDEDWFRILKKLYRMFACSIVETNDIVQFFNQETGLSLTGFFDQYLYHEKQPVLKYKLDMKGKRVVLTHQWDEKVTEGFSMPVFVGNANKEIKIFPTHEVQKEAIDFESLRDIEIKTSKGYFKAKASNFR